MFKVLIGEDVPQLSLAKDGTVSPYNGEGELDPQVHKLVKI